MTLAAVTKVKVSVSAPGDTTDRSFEEEIIEVEKLI